MNKIDKALQYLQDKHDAQFASTYGEPGYSDPERGIIFANWNNIPKGLQDWLERCGYSLEWSDEWVEVDGKAYRTEPDSYGWRPTAVLLAESCEYLTPDDGACAAIDAMQMTDHGHLCQAVPHWVTAEDLREEGFEPYRTDCESGHHYGQTDDPRKVSREAFDHGATAVIFYVIGVGQFDVHWQCWARWDEPQFDRFDICAAYRQLEADYIVGGWLRERPSNTRRMESIGVQLARMNYRPSPLGDMSLNAWAIYRAAARRMGLVK